MSAESEKQAHELAEELESTLNNEWVSRQDYREAIEEVVSFFGSILSALDEEDEA